MSLAVSNTSNSRADAATASSVPAISQPIAISGQFSRSCRVMNATRSPLLSEPCATASTPKQVTPASTTCG